MLSQVEMIKARNAAQKRLSGKDPGEKRFAALMGKLEVLESELSALLKAFAESGLIAPPSEEKPADPPNEQADAEPVQITAEPKGEPPSPKEKQGKKK